MSRIALIAVLGLAVVACATQTNDPPKPYAIPGASGKADKIKDVVDPASPKHKNDKDSASVSGAAVVHVDTFDETLNGKSTGTIYVQDVGSDADPDKPEPFSGISLFAPTFVPGNLKVGPGDVLEMTGTYQENKNISTAVFAMGPPQAVLAQIAQPTATFMYETRAIQPVNITLEDLQTFEKGRRWIGMLVRVKNLKLFGDLSRAEMTGGRFSMDLSDPPPGFKNACDAPFPRPAAITNELMDLPRYITEQAKDPAFAKNPTFSEVVGVVTFFCNLHLSPRSAADFKR